MKTISFKKYQELAHQTAQYPTEIMLFDKYDSTGKLINYNNLSWVYPAIGLAGETGEVLNQLKKVIRDDNGIMTEERKKKIIDELGDTLWYVAEACTRLNVDMDNVAQLNILKLQAREKLNTIKGDKRDGS